MSGLASRVADVFARAIEEAVSEKGGCAVALSRPTPETVFREADRRRIPRRRVHIYQVDERAAKKGSDDRNLTLIERHLGRWVRDAHVHEMPADADALPGSARSYSKSLSDALGAPPVFDVVHLGLGPDGHTASLLVDDPVLAVDDAWVAPSKRKDGYRRLTITYPVIDAARLVIFVVAGAEKSEALRGVLTGDRSLPAARIRNVNVRVYADAAAASRL